MTKQSKQSVMAIVRIMPLTFTLHRILFIRLSNVKDQQDNHKIISAFSNILVFFFLNAAIKNKNLVAMNKGNNSYLNFYLMAFKKWVIQSNRAEILSVIFSLLKFYLSVFEIIF